MERILLRFFETFRIFSPGFIDHQAFQIWDKLKILKNILPFGGFMVYSDLSIFLILSLLWEGIYDSNESRYCKKNC
jgi:hypothetical protein